MYLIFDVETSGMDETIVYLLHADPNVLDIKDGRGKTPLFYARNPKIVLLFQYFDNNIIKRDLDGKPVLKDFLKRNIENAKALFSSQIDSNGKDCNANDLLLTFDLDVFKFEKKKQTRSAYINFSIWQIIFIWYL